MKIVLITGTHPRHIFIANVLYKTGCLAALIIEERENIHPLPPDYLSDEQRILFIEHFKLREITELNSFEENNFPVVPTIKLPKDKINSQKVQSLIQKYDPELLISYGCHILSEETLSFARHEKWNCHGGLSPWYRGAITHFWPSYMLEPQMTGMTVHDLTPKLDAGDVVHQCVAPLELGDKLHDLAVKAVRELGNDLPQLVRKIASKEKIIKKQHKTSGVLWLASMWRPEHLDIIYNQYNDKIVDYYLNGKFKQTKPDLHRQFD